MANDFRMPSLGPDMEVGTLVQWRIKPGDVVKRGDIVALVETDKGIIDVEIFADGTVERLLVAEGTRVPVGTVLAQLNGGIVSASGPLSTAPAAEPPPVRDERRRKVSPAARVRARELGVDLDQVEGTGPGQAITIDDVVRSAQNRKEASHEPPHDMRQAIARAMSRSKREIPHYYLSMTCSFAKARAFLERHNASADIESRLLPSAILLKAVVHAAKGMPEFNGFYRNDTFHPASEVHVGMAIAMRGGRLVAPAILNADQKPLTIIMKELRDLTTRVRAGHMRSSELAMPTITVTSLAEEGVDSVIPAIYPPQVAIVGVGSILERPWVVDGLVQPEQVVTICVAADHRVTDGRAGARFLTLMRDALQAPEQL